MPETAKVNRLEEASSSTEEPGMGAKTRAKHPIETSSADLQPMPATAEKVHEATDAPKPDVPEEKSVRTVAADSEDGPAEAVETEDAEPEENEGLDEGTDSSDHGSDEDFFAGWDGFDDIHDLSAEQELADDDEELAQPFEDGAGHRTLSEIALASGTLHTLEGSSDSGAGLSSKHDELAEAVQDALMNVYGEAPSVMPARKALPSPDLHGSGPGWANNDTLSPQDVILNYFDYQPGPERGRGDVANHAEAAYLGDTPDIFGQAQSHPASLHRPSSPAAHAGYDDFPAYPPSAGRAAAPKAAAAADRESSRLLGAAAIGLVGGIAIAASLAVFVINSYGPGGRTLPGAANPALDAASPGYGRWVKSSAEPETPKIAAVASPLDAAPVIAASDVPVISGQPSPLAIEVKPEQANERNLISITGIPEGARLNAGVDAGGGNWLLPPRRLNGLTINVPAGAPDTVLLAVQVLDSNVRTPLSERKQFAIRVSAAKTEPAAPAAAPAQTEPLIATLQRVQPESASVPETPPPAKPAPSFFSTETVPASPSTTAPQAKPASATGAPQQFAPSRQAALPAAATPSSQPNVAPRTEIEEMIREGNKRMREGDILEARALYQKAIALGDPEAALAMGRSYDPIYFARIDRKNAEPDAAKAFDWYRKAMDGGAAQTAKVRIENLKHYLNQ